MRPSDGPETCTPPLTPVCSEVRWQALGTEMQTSPARVRRAPSTISGHGSHSTRGSLHSRGAATGPPPPPLLLQAHLLPGSIPRFTPCWAQIPLLTCLPPCQAVWGVSEPRAHREDTFRESRTSTERSGHPKAGLKRATCPPHPRALAVARALAPAWSPGRACEGADRLDPRGTPQRVSSLWKPEYLPPSNSDTPGWHNQAGHRGAPRLPSPAGVRAAANRGRAAGRGPWVSHLHLLLPSLSQEVWKAHLPEDEQTPGAASSPRAASPGTGRGRALHLHFYPPPSSGISIRFSPGTILIPRHGQGCSPRQVSGHLTHLPKGGW